MIEIEPSKLNGVYKLTPKIISDERGRFVKTFHQSTYDSLGSETDYAEEYYTVSHKNVIRGLHFQLPPMEHSKIVCCIEGHAVDVVVDLRRNSPTYGEFEMFDLNSTNSISIFIPKGMAHGFCAMVDNTILMYKVSTEYSPAYDTGILWNSVGVPWSITDGILSAKDRNLPAFVAYKSTFLI